MRLEVYPPMDWDKYFAAHAHALCFNGEKLRDKPRYDFAVLATHEATPVGYVTAAVIDDKTCFLQFGGAFPAARKSLLAFKAYRQMIEFVRAKHPIISTVIDNENIAMLKMAFTVGFRIIGVQAGAGVKLQLLLGG